jgi:hypothetical protein
MKHIGPSHGREACYGTMAVNCPGTLICITPAHMHMSLASLFSAGMLPINTVGLPTIQGAVVAGTQGIGVSTPRAAAVAAATVGLARLEHTPKGMILTKGALSMIVAAGILVVRVWRIGKTFSMAGAAPKLHWIVAPLHTQIPISAYSFI